MPDPSVNIESITFSRLVNKGNYENERFEITLKPANSEMTARKLFNAAYIIVDKAVDDRTNKSSRKMS